MLLQIADVTFGPLGVPNWGMAALIVVALLGLPLAIGPTWFYEAGGHGIERDTGPGGAPRHAVRRLRRHAKLAIIAVQDEAAAQVTEALKLSLSSGSTERMRARATGIRGMRGAGGRVWGDLSGFVRNPTGPAKPDHRHLPISLRGSS